VLELGSGRDSFGSEDGWHTYIPDEEGSDYPKQQAHFFKLQQTIYLQLLINTANFIPEGFGTIVGEYAFSIDIFPPSLKIYQSDYIIESRFDLF
jgi:hypothetical protein